MPAVAFDVDIVGDQSTERCCEMETCGDRASSLRTQGPFIFYPNNNFVNLNLFPPQWIPLVRHGTKLDMLLST